MFQFVYADKREIDQMLPKLFALLHANMSLIAPTNNSYEEDYQMWFSAVRPAMEKEPRKIVLMYAEKQLIGYFQYYVNIAQKSLMMEEIQIEKAFQGTGVFSEFYKWLVAQLPLDLETVEAYADKRNVKSQAVLLHLGLAAIGENKSGNMFHFQGLYSNLLNRYSKV